MRYKIMVKGAAYKAARTAKLYTAQIYRAVSIKLIITLPDGTPLSGQTVNINGTDMTTGTDGQVILTGDMGLTTKLHIVYNVTYTADVDVTYVADASYTVALEEHVTAGSVTVSEWAFISTSSYAKKPYTLVVPPVVTVVKMTGSKYRSSTKIKAGYVGTNGEAIQHGDVEIAYLAYGSRTFEKYVGVTPGETYTIYGRNVAADATIEWSDEINAHAVDVTI
ncbi:hypothetical protein [Phascolarctobacterium succinatutens]